MPQGSVSNTKLFNLYLNSVENVIERSQINMLANDTMLCNNMKLAEEQVNEDLLNSEKWLSKIKLK